MVVQRSGVRDGRFHVFMIGTIYGFIYDRHELHISAERLQSPMLRWSDTWSFSSSVGSTQNLYILGGYEA